MRIITIIIILLHGALLHAEQPKLRLVTPEATPQLTETAEDLERTGRAERVVGIVVTSIGLAAAAFAVFSFSVAANANPQSDAVIAGRAYGVLGSLVAGVHLGVGIPLWIDGSRRIETARRIRLAPAPEGSLGAGLSVTF